MVFLYTFWSSFISITKKLRTSYYKYFLFFHCFYFVDFFLISGFYQIYKEKSIFFSCSRNWNCESNLKWAKNGPKKSTATQKEYLEIFLLLCILRKQKKKLLSEGSLNLSFKDVLWLKQKTTLFLDSHIYICIYIYPILTIELCK